MKDFLRFVVGLINLTAASVVLMIIFLISFNFFEKFKKETSFYPKVTVDFQIRPDGSFTVTEKRSISYQSPHTQILWYIPYKKRAAIQNITVAENDLYKGIIPYVQISNIDEAHSPHRFVVKQNKGFIDIKAYHESKNEIQTFILSYDVHEGIKKYRDVADFYWEIIDDTWNNTTKEISGTISLPQPVPKEQILAWGQYFKNQQVYISDEKTIVYSLENLEAKTSLGIRIAFPSYLIAGNSESSFGLEKIKKEEGKKLLWKKSVYFFIPVAAIIWVICWIIYWIIVWFRIGKEYSKIHVPKYLLHPPSPLSPALVEAFTTQGRVTENSFTAVVLYLIKKNIILVETHPYYEKNSYFPLGKRKYNYILHLNSENIEKAGLKKSESMVFDFIKSFSRNGKTVNLRSMKKAIKRNPRSIERMFTNKWRVQIKQELRELNVIELKSERWHKIFHFYNRPYYDMLMTFFIILTLASPMKIGGGLVLDYVNGKFIKFSNAFLSFFMYIVFLFSLAILFFIFLAIVCYVYPKIIDYFFGCIVNSFLKWTKEARTEVLKWKAFKNYIENISRLEKESPHAVVIWEDVLIYATALGISKKTIVSLSSVLFSDINNVGPFFYSSNIYTSFISHSSRDYFSDAPGDDISAVFGDFSQSLPLIVY